MWCTTIDKFTCDKCLSMDGKILTLQEVMKFKSSIHKSKNMICRCYMMEL